MNYSNMCDRKYFQKVFYPIADSSTSFSRDYQIGSILNLRGVLNVKSQFSCSKLLYTVSNKCIFTQCLPDNRLCAKWWILNHTFHQLYCILLDCIKCGLACILQWRNWINVQRLIRQACTWVDLWYRRNKLWIWIMDA